MTDNEIIKEATEAYNQNLCAGCYVGDLLRIINRLEAQKVWLENEIINRECVIKRFIGILGE